MSTTGPFRFSLHPADAGVDLLPSTLAVVRFGGPAANPPADARCITVPLPALGPACEERWEAVEPVERGRCGRFSWIRGGEALVVRGGIEQIEEAAFEEQVEALYRELYSLLESMGHAHLLRVWQYIGHLHSAHRGLDRYQRFCAGRHRATDERVPREHLPAATVIGSRGTGFTLYALAAPQPALQIENPRQVSAFQYPPDYGPVSPAFSRAVLKRWAAGAMHLYISGTASIVGHASRHPEDAEAQLAETLQNLEALLDQARRAGAPALRLDELSIFRLYVRHRPHAGRLQMRFREWVGSDVPLVMLEGEVCRRELLLEVEAAWYGG